MRSPARPALPALRPNDGAEARLEALETAIYSLYQWQCRQWNYNRFLRRQARGDHDHDQTLAAETSHSITDPADNPADADALREDLVDNVIPSIEAALNALGIQINLAYTE